MSDAQSPDAQSPDAQSATVAPWNAPPSRAPGMLRRVRRVADLSQRDLAERLGVSQSTIAGWETGRSSPPLATLEQVAHHAGLRLALVDADQLQVDPMSEAAARDRAGRRYPAHVDVRSEGWWAPVGADLTGEGPSITARSAALGIPQVRYRRRGLWRNVFRSFHGIPDDHPPLTDLVADVLERESREDGATGVHSPETGTAVGLEPD